MSDILLKSVRIDDRRIDKDGTKISVYQSGKRKQAIWYNYDKNYDKKSEKVNIAYDTDDLINDFLSKNNNGNIKYKIIQDPYDDKSIKRKYGSTPYYLNDGSYMLIKWYDNGVYKESDNDDFNGEYKIVELYPPKNYPLNDYYTFYLDGVLSIDYSSNILDHTKYDENNKKSQNKESGYIKDSELVKKYLSSLKIFLSKINSSIISDIKLDLCDIDTEYCSIIEFKDYMIKKSSNIIDETLNKEPIGITQSVSNKKLSINIEGLNDNLIIKSNTNIPDFTIYIGDIPIAGNVDEFTELPELDNEYTEGEYVGSEEIPYDPPPVDISDYKSDIDGVENNLNINKEIVQPASGSINDKQKAFIKNALTLALSNGIGLCAKYTYSHANNYSRQIKNLPISSKMGGHGNANSDLYFKSLVSLGYKKYNQGKVDTITLKNSLNSNKWDIGDVVVYWGDGNKDQGACQYGHTQIFTGGYNISTSKPSIARWASDGITNYGCNYVYGMRNKTYTTSNGKTLEAIYVWNYIIFKAPQPSSGLS